MAAPEREEDVTKGTLDSAATVTPPTPADTKEPTIAQSSGPRSYRLEAMEPTARRCELAPVSEPTVQPASNTIANSCLCLDLEVAHALGIGPYRITHQVLYAEGGRSTQVLPAATMHHSVGVGLPPGPLIPIVMYLGLKIRKSYSVEQWR